MLEQFFNVSTPGNKWCLDWSWLQNIYPFPFLTFFLPFPATKSQSQWPKSHFPRTKTGQSQFPFYPFRTLFWDRQGSSRISPDIGILNKQIQCEHLAIVRACMPSISMCVSSNSSNICLFASERKYMARWRTHSTVMKTKVRQTFFLRNSLFKMVALLVHVTQPRSQGPSRRYPNLVPRVLRLLGHGKDQRPPAHQEAWGLWVRDCHHLNCEKHRDKPLQPAALSR